LATPPLVQSFPFVAWILLVALSVGSLLFAVVTRQLSDATTGYLRFTSVTAALVALLALAVEGSLSTTESLIIGASPPDVAALRGNALVAVALLATAYAVVLRRPRLALAVGAAALAAAALAVVAAAFGWAPTAADAVPFAVQLSALSVVTGGSLAAIVLGHWYLVTPKISERPLVLQARLLLAAIAIQALLFVTWTTLGGGPGQAPFSALQGSSVLLVALRLAVTIVFPLVLVYMAWRTAQTRSMESATGLLYINLAAVMAGTIGAGALYVSSGLLV
jgi:hypothetical protein